MSEKRALFFCSANTDINPEYNQAAREIVRAACLRGYEIVSGGAIKGMMKIVCDTAKEQNARIRGIMPTFMKGLEYPDLTELVWTETMSQRKDAMREDTSVAITLPGGIGTLDEITETLCLAKLGKYTGKTIIFNYKGFYSIYKQLLEHFVKEGMYPQESLDQIYFPETVEELSALL